MIGCVNGDEDRVSPTSLRSAGAPLRSERPTTP